MKNKILHKAGELFIALGVKSVTMDDIAQHMAISKKTIYEYFQNKHELVKATSEYLFDQITQKIEGLCDNKNESPIKALFEINKLIFNELNESNHTEFQFSKYYPEIYQSLSKRKFETVIEGITENMQRGVAMGLYRSDIDIDMIARFYFTGTNGLKDLDIFPHDQFKLSRKMTTYLEYHIRAIATSKGLAELEKYLQENPL